MKTGSIYLILNSIDRKGYVGFTSQPIKRRFAEHIQCAKGGRDTALYRAMRKHGIENFTIQEIASAELLLLPDLEKHYITFFNTFITSGFGYNLTRGGDGVIGRQWTEEQRRKQSASVRAAYAHKIWTPEQRKARGSHNVGRRAHNKGVRGIVKASKETRALLTAMRTGLPCSQSTRDKISRSLLGHTVTAETRSKLWLKRRAKMENP